MWKHKNGNTTLSHCALTPVPEVSSFLDPETTIAKLKNTGQTLGKKNSECKKSQTQAAYKSISSENIPRKLSF